MSPDDLGENKVKFVTFNYDRSFEFFLHDATKNTFGIADEAAIKAWKKLGIIHVYGLMGEFNYTPQDNARQYMVDLSKASLMKAANGILIVPEARDEAPEFLAARALFDSAERICFLGFGFDSLNLRRLGLKDIAARRIERKHSALQIFASVLGKTDAEVKSYHAQIGLNKVHWNSYNLENLMTLRSTPILLP